MSFTDYIRRFLAGFLCAAVILPILAVLLSVFGTVLGSLGDLGGERFQEPPAVGKKGTKSGGSPRLSSRLRCWQENCQNDTPTTFYFLLKTNICLKTGKNLAVFTGFVFFGLLVA